MKAGALIAVFATGCLSTPASPEGASHRWIELPTANQPGKLHSPDMVYDDARQTVVLYGGIDESRAALTATWELDVDGVWRRICAESEPPPLHQPALGHDSRTQRLILAGGSTTDDLMSPVNDVYVCNSSDVRGWTHVGTLPFPVAGAQLLDDRGRGAMAIFGGTGDMGMVEGVIYLSTDLQNWTARPVPAPTALGGAAPTATYDKNRERILALKNYTSRYGSSAEPTDELWEIATGDTQWSRVCGPCSNEPRSEAGLVHFIATDNVFMMNGLGRNRGELEGAWILDNDRFVRSHDDPPARDRGAYAYNESNETLVVYGGNGPGCDGNCGTTWFMTAE